MGPPGYGPSGGDHYDLSPSDIGSSNRGGFPESGTRRRLRHGGGSGTEHRVISIGRQFGSGGHEIGLKTADWLGIRCYDKELIALAAAHGELSHEKLTAFDEKQENPWLYEAVYEGNHHVPKGQSFSAALYQLQSEVILSIAQREDAVIIGRCADQLLRNVQDVRLLTVFIAAPFTMRVERKMELERLERKKAEALVRKTDKQRGLYYQSHTGLEWGRRNAFDLYFDSHEQSKEAIVSAIMDAYSRML